jgi:hypothetical protein
LPHILVNLGYQHLLNKFNFAKSHFFISLAATINCIPDPSPKIMYYQFITERSKPTPQNLKGELLLLFLLYPGFLNHEPLHSQKSRSIFMGVYSPSAILWHLYA